MGWNLPPEVMIEVFSHLAPLELDSASLVCKQWYEVLTNEASWRESFGRIFGTTRFNRVSTSLKWRTELINRMEDVRKWKRKAKTGNFKNVSFNCHVNITHVFSDLAAARIIVFSQHNGMGLVADPTKGKLAKPPIYTEKSLQVTGDVSALDGSRFGMIFGMIDGHVRALLYSQGTRIRDYFRMSQSHNSIVTAAWMNKTESPRGVTSSSGVGVRKFQAITGSDSGQLFVWDIVSGEPVEYTLPASITQIECDSKSIIIVGLADGSLWILLAGKSQFTKLADGVVAQHVSTFKADFESGFVLCGSRDKLWRVGLETGQVVEFGGLVGEICAFAMDNSPTNQEVDTKSDRDAPGQHARYFAVATSADHIYFYVLQDEPGEETQQKIEPFRVKQSPFLVQDSSNPSITAMAMNSSVILLGSFNGITIAFDLLTGDRLSTVSSRFSKRALNFRQQQEEDPGLYPITHLEIDQNSSNPHGIIVVRSAVQYFDFGASFDDTAERKRGIKKRRRVNAPLWGGTTVLNKTELNKDIESDLAMMQSEDEHDAEGGEFYSEEFIGEGLTEEEQMKLALMMSGEQSAHPSFTDNDGEGVVDEEEEEMKRAIEMSLQTTTSRGKQKVEEEPDYQDESDDEVKAAIAASLGQESPDNEVDEDLALALKLSSMQQ